MKHTGKSAAIFALAFSVAGGVHAAEPTWLVAPLQDQQAVIGCAWVASAPSLGQGYVFMADYDDSAIVMNIGGSDTALTATGKSGRLQAVGDVMQRSYRADGVEVQARYEATWVCPAGAEGCEVVEFDATYEVRKGSRTQLIEAAGTIGC